MLLYQSSVFQLLPVSSGYQYCTLINLNVKAFEVCYYFVNVLRFFFFFSLNKGKYLKSLFVGRSKSGIYHADVSASLFE